MIAFLQRHVAEESDAGLTHRMHFPTGWDPFVTDTVTLTDVYHYATQHFDYHREQLTLEQASP